MAFWALFSANSPGSNYSRNDFVLQITLNWSGYVPMAQGDVYWLYERSGRPGRWQGGYPMRFSQWEVI